MSHLTLNTAVSMNKVTISFWFRVPTESAQAEDISVGGYPDVMDGVIPLITWGDGIPVTVAETTVTDTGAIDSSANIIFIETVSVSHQSYVSPSYIGIYVHTPSTLEVHIQTNDNASGSGLAFIASSWTGDFVGINTTPPGVGKPIYDNVVYVQEDVSSTLTAIPEYLGNSSAVGGSGAGQPEVTLDDWHHLLISWDLQGNGSKMWCAIDDVNKDGSTGDLPAMNDPSKMAPNDHLSWLPYKYADDPDASVSVSFTEIPSKPMSIPSLTKIQFYDGAIKSRNPIKKVELAELQIFSGVALDTSKESNRHAFIDVKRDSNGNPTSDAALYPVSPKKAEELLGKKPDVLLHGSNKWKHGNNTGSLGVDSDGNKVRAGQFDPSGDIKRYKPDPSIAPASEVA